jgi:hypothetical protein
MATQVTYPPLDTPKPVAGGVWIVDSGPISAFGLPLPVRMTVIKLAEGGLLLYSPTRFSPQLRSALERIGPIRHLVSPSLAHWVFLREWQRTLPDAVTWAAPGVRKRGAVRKAGLQIDRELGDVAPAPWTADLELIGVPGGLGFVEIVLFHKLTRTMIFCDLVQNLEPQKLPLAARLVLGAMGALGPDARPPVYLRAIVKGGGAAAREAAQRLITLAPERLIMTHGRVVEGQGTERLRRSLGWLVG